MKKWNVLLKVGNKYMKMYDYLIAYKFKQEGYLSAGDGTIGISRKKKITTFEDIDAVIELIKKENEGISNVGIYNIMLLGRNEH